MLALGLPRRIEGPAPTRVEVVIRRYVLVLLVGIVAALHVLVAATTRPMLQVSDEISYLYAAQYTAAGQHRVSPSLYPCLSPPDGDMLPLLSSGKLAYRETSARLLTVSCRVVGPYLAFISTRLVLGLSLLVIVASGWAFARVVCPQTALLPEMVAIVLALHPVLVIYAAGITPDSGGNAFAALTWLLTAIVVCRANGLLWLPLLTVCVAGGVLWKDTTNFLAVLPLLSVPLAAWSQRGQSRLVGLAVIWLLACGAAVFVAREWFASPYTVIGPLVARLAAAPVDTLGLLMADVTPRLPGLFDSSWRELGGFGASPRALAAGVFVPIAAASLVALAGLLRSVVVTPAWMGDDTARRWRAQVALWVVASVLCAMQAAVRRVGEPNADIDQGRWMFPLAVPLATALVGGLACWLREPARLAPLVAVGAAVVAVVAQVQTVGHYYLQFPVSYARDRLFLEGTGGAFLGRGRVEALTARPSLLQDPMLMGALLTMAGVALVALVIVVWLAAGRTTSDKASHA